jgi:hypothetical protein
MWTRVQKADAMSNDVSVKLFQLEGTKKTRGMPESGVHQYLKPPQSGTSPVLLKVIIYQPPNIILP